MTGENSRSVLPALSATVLVIVALYFASDIFAPVAMSLFVITILWPLQKALETAIPRLFALLLTLAATVVVLGTFGLLTAGAITLVGRWLIANISHFYALYGQTMAWFDGHGILLADQISERFNVLSLVGFFQEVGRRINGLVGFSLMVLIFTMLGLLEVGDFKQKIRTLRGDETGDRLLAATAVISQKFRKYIVVRTGASVVTGLAMWGFALALNIELATAWGIIGFALNYIPFIGSLIATVLPTLFAAAQFASWQMALLVFLGLNAIQFVIGSYLEPRFSGNALAISPFVVVVSVFFWAFLWGIPGAFIGVPIMIAILTICEMNESSRWIATLLSGPAHKDSQEQQ